VKYEALNIRNFPSDLKKKLQALAKKHHRSLTQEIILALEVYLEREAEVPENKVR
jgi:plasmid stability protein